MKRKLVSVLVCATMLGQTCNAGNDNPTFDLMDERNENQRDYNDPQPPFPALLMGKHI